MPRLRARLPLIPQRSNQGADMSDSPLLSDDDLLELSGYKTGAWQAKFLLRAYGLNVPRRKDGRVRVTWEAINQAVARGKAAPATGPRWTK